MAFFAKKNTVSSLTHTLNLTYIYSIMLLFKTGENVNTWVVFSGVVSIASDKTPKITQVERRVC